jgi:hypothetical protein
MQAYDYNTILSPNSYPRIYIPGSWMVSVFGLSVLVCLVACEWYVVCSSILRRG